MKWFNNLAIIVIAFCIVSTTLATDLNGRVKLINNDGNNYKVMLQININSEPQNLGGATIIIDYDNTILSYPDKPIMGIDFIFNNFNMGFYDTAKVTKVTGSQIWINVDLISDEYGTFVAGGPHQWTDLVMLNFVSNNIVTRKVVFWNIYSSYWGVYNSDNATMWGIGNFDNISTSVEGEGLDDKDYSYSLSQNYPNPFNPSTKISWQSPAGSWQTLKVYDVLGNEVATLVDEYKPAGKYEVEFLVSNLPSGIYFYRLQSDSYMETKKMILLK
jgi:hypothetical protein